MKIWRVVLVLAAGAALMMVAGCAKPPKQEIDAAKAAVLAAKTAEADKYLPDQFNTAKAALDAALAEVAAQDAKGALSRKYEEAKKILTEAKTAADQAIAAVAAQKEEVMQEVLKLAAEAEKAVKDAEQAVKKAPKKMKAAAKEAEKALVGVKAVIADGKKAMESGELLSAKEKLSGAIAQAAELVNKVQPAAKAPATKVSAKKKKK